jgi:hypothetical protein
LHFLGAGSDVRVPVIFGLAWTCTAAVVIAVGFRLAAGTSKWSPPRLTGAVASLAVPALIFTWAMQGPMQPGWAKRSGTPARLLPHAAAIVPAPPAATSQQAAVRRAAPRRLSIPFTTRFTGTERRTPLHPGRVRLDLLANLPGGSGTLLVSLAGPAKGAGVRWTQGGALFGPTARPDLYRGGVMAYDGRTFALRLSSAHRSDIDVRMTVRRLAGGRIDGTITAKGTAPIPAIAPRKVVPIAGSAPTPRAPARPVPTPQPVRPPLSPAPTPSPIPSPSLSGSDDHGDDLGGG